MNTASHDKADELLQSILSSCAQAQRALNKQTDCARGITEHLKEVDEAMSEIAEDFET